MHHHWMAEAIVHPGPELVTTSSTLHAVHLCLSVFELLARLHAEQHFNESRKILMMTIQVVVTTLWLVATVAMTLLQKILALGAMGTYLVTLHRLQNLIVPPMHQLLTSSRCHRLQMLVPAMSFTI